MGRAAWIKDPADSTWKVVDYPTIKNSGSWEEEPYGWVKHNGQWENFYIRRSFSYNKTFSTDTSDYDLYADLVTNGWDEIQTVTVTITINAGIYIYSTNVSNPAFDMGGTFPDGSVINVTNNGYIYGHGGAAGNGSGGTWSNSSATGIADWRDLGNGNNGSNGGTAFKATDDISIDNTNGEIKGGGGGGGGGVGVLNGHPSTTTTAQDIEGGGGGGGGAGGYSGSGGAGGSGGSVSGAVGSNTNGTGGTTPTGTTGGGGGAGGAGTDTAITPGAGGAGGDLGSDGSSGSDASSTAGTQRETDYSPGSGGLSGYYIEGNSYVTWTATGTTAGRVS